MCSQSRGNSQPPLWGARGDLFPRIQLFFRNLLVLHEFDMGRWLLLPCVLLWSAAAWAQGDAYDALKTRCRAGSEVDCNGWAALSAERCEDGIGAACQDLIALAKEGWADAQYRLGLAYAAGRGFQPSLGHAKILLLEAAEQGHVWARQWFEHDPAALDGAFGFKLGEPFTPPAGAKVEHTPEGMRYAVQPAEPVHPFTQYFVVTTPKSGLIHTIEAEVELEQDPAQRQFAAAHLRLQKELWIQPQESRPIDQARVDFVSKEGRAARLSRKFHTLSVQFRDPYMLEQGLAESSP